MISTYVKSYESVLQQVDEIELARFYLSMEPGRFYKSLFRDDKKPSATLYYNHAGKIQYNDFIYHYGLMYAIMEYHGWTYREFLIRVTKDFNLQSLMVDSYIPTFNKVSVSMDSNIRKKTIIERKFREFEQHDLEFWNQYGITKEWLIHPAVKVRPISHFWIDNYKGRRLIKADKHAYCYDYFEYEDRFLRKIYQPYSRSAKWISNVVSGQGGVCQLWETLPKEGRDLLIITSSLKDGGSIYCNTFNVFNRNEGVFCLAPNTENGFLPDQIVPKINNRFKRILTWFDNDNAGILAGKKYLNEYGWEPIYNPVDYPKDPSDFRKEFGQREFISLFRHLVYDT
jgi:hypothetical protein